MATRTLRKASPKKAAAKNGKLEALSVEQLLARMDELKPKWKIYEDAARKQMPMEQRKHKREHAEWGKCYDAIRAKGLTIREARKQVAT